MGEHQFMNPDNFCLENNQLKFLDYGGGEAQIAIMEDGEKLLGFDPDWDYEEYKKSRPDEYPPATTE